MLIEGLAYLNNQPDDRNKVADTEAERDWHFIEGRMIILFVLDWIRFFFERQLHIKYSNLVWRIQPEGWVQPWR